MHPRSHQAALPLVTPEGLDRKFYEICAPSGFQQRPAPGDIQVKWARGSSAIR